jgi:hypothetical protein
VTEEPAAARRYKDVLAELSAAAVELRERDRARAGVIRDQLLGLEDEMVRAGERARLTGVVARLHWEAALDLLWDESWLKLSPRPRPDRNVDPGRLDELDEQLHLRSTELRHAVKRRWYKLPPR